jgi:hypothetical protein
MVLLVALGALGGLAPVAGAVGARKVRLHVDYSIGGTYHSEFVSGDCQDSYSETATFSYGFTYRSMVLPLQSRAHATQRGAAVATGDWKATGTWHDEDCSGSHSQECEGNTGLVKPEGVPQIAVIVDQHGRVYISPASGAQYLGELGIDQSDCRSGFPSPLKQGEPSWSMRFAMDGLDPPLATTTLRALATHRRLVLTPRRSKANGGGCDGIDGCTGFLKARPKLVVKISRP